MKKIVYILKARIPTEKAHGYQTMKMIEGFFENRCDIQAWIPTRQNTNKLSNTRIDDYYNLRFTPDIVRLKGLDFIYIVRKKLNRPSIKLIHLASIMNSVVFYIMVIFKIISTKKVDYYYTRDHNLAQVLLVFTPWIKSRLFVEMHSLSLTKKKKYRQVRILKKVAGIITMTYKMRDELIDLGVSEDKILAEHDAVDIKQFSLDKTREEARDRLGMSSNKNILLFIGKFHTKGQEKGIPEIIRATSILCKEFSNIKVFIVGGPMDRVYKYEQLILQLNIPNNIINFFDKRPVQDIPLWLKSADILLMPHPYSNFYENYVSPLKMFEYMASGRAIIASDLPSIKEVLTHKESALLSPPGDFESIAENAKILLSDKVFANSIACNALIKVADYSWNLRAKRVLKFMISA
jgi:glycosyltransferase involved in cell wall biosynthesis